MHNNVSVYCANKGKANTEECTNTSADLEELRNSPSLCHLQDWTAGYWINHSKLLHTVVPV